MLLPQVTTGSDVYSFGVLLWSLYTGKNPYTHNKAGLLVPSSYFPLFPPATLPEYRDLANSCLRRDPHLRPSFVEITRKLVEFFNRESQGAGTGASATTGPAPAGGPARPAPPFLDGAQG